jgi:hypothetical protein
LLLFAWGPIVATRTLMGIALITALAFFGTQMLRRETATEFPDARLASAPAGTSSGQSSAPPPTDKSQSP